MERLVMPGRMRRDAELAARELRYRLLAIAEQVSGELARCSDRRGCERILRRAILHPPLREP